MARTKVYRYYRFLLSPKIPQLARRIYADLTAAQDAAKGIHYVYVSDARAALLLAKTLNKVLRLPQLKNAADVDPGAGPYFIMINEEGSKLRMVSGFKTPKSNIPGLKALASSDANARGGIIKVVIATRKSFKGVDLRHVRYLHLLDPFVNFRDFIQFVGRGPRNCSHKALPVQQRKVDVFLYRLAYSPQERCDTARAALADCFLWNESYRRYTGAGGFKELEDKVLWEPSVDYELFKDNLSTARNALKDVLDNMQTCYDPGRRNAGEMAGFMELGETVRKYRRAQVQKRVQERHAPEAFAPIRQAAYKKRRASDPAAANLEFPRAAQWAAYTAEARPLKRELARLRRRMPSATGANDVNSVTAKNMVSVLVQLTRLRERYPAAAAYANYKANLARQVKQMNKYINVVAENIRT
jgi:hypothetical protein